MIRVLLIGLLLCLSNNTFSQSFELVEKTDYLHTTISEVFQIPIRIRNKSDKAQFFIIRKVSSDLGATQKGYFCLDQNCLEPSIEEFSKRIEPGETLEKLYYTLETGIITGQNHFKFEVFIKGQPSTIVEYPVNLSIEERGSKTFVFQSKDIKIRDVYPNPVNDYAYLDYQLYNESAKAKVVVYNILGREMGDYDLSLYEFKVKIQAEELASGVYFYTIYLDNVAIVTRKMIVRK
ncbi:MAG: T9SS type A sorting domain-containing protein [Flammeovirgaceae bacterium]|nr:T9SS type A sorting domain-containing protein [Flammeovirgaceae bacterium]